VAAGGDSGPGVPGSGYRICAGAPGDRPVRIVKPQTYMNRSGAVLGPLHASAGFDPATELLVLVDDVALPVGRFRLRGAGARPAGTMD
jgi:peptidyl-tRNA hydrolase, PTH1 family